MANYRAASKTSSYRGSPKRYDGSSATGTSLSGYAQTGYGSYGSSATYGSYGSSATGYYGDSYGKTTGYGSYGSSMTGYDSYGYDSATPTQVAPVAQVTSSKTSSYASSAKGYDSVTHTGSTVAQAISSETSSNSSKIGDSPMALAMAKHAANQDFKSSRQAAESAAARRKATTRLLPTRTW